MLSPFQKNVAFVGGWVLMLGAAFAFVWNSTHGASPSKYDLIMYSVLFGAGLVAALFDRLIQLIQKVGPMLPFVKKK